MFNRLLNILKTNSFLLFGARGTGKTFLLQELFSPKDSYLINLLDSEILAPLQSNPSLLTDIVKKQQKEWIIIDEVQKVPALLDQVHLLIEQEQQKFALSGSSARKLKRGSANLLAGRAFVYNLFPLTHLEIGEDFDLDDTLSFGSLPKIFDLHSTREKKLFLKSYADTYLKEEVLIEQLIRNLPPFRKFLELAAIQDTELISLSRIGRDILVDPKIVSSYYSILEDTLLGFKLEPFNTSIRKRQKKSPKFYWFDLGVRRYLSGTLDNAIVPKTYEYGSLFESFFINEVHRLLTYSEAYFRLSFIRIDENFEVDLVIERTGLPTFLLEIKSTDRANESHTKVLAKVKGEIKNSRAILVTQDKIEKTINGIECLHWRSAIKELGIALPH